MDELAREVEDVFRIVSSIPVTNDAIDASAVARAKLRNLYTKLKKMAEDGNETVNA